MLTKNINNDNISWSIIFGLWLIYFCFGYSVSSIAPIVPYITHDLNISYKQMGLILGAWQFTYMFFALPAGFILDRYGLKASIFLAALIITLSLISRGLSNNFYHMWLAVALFGIGGPLISVGVPKVSSLWKGEKSRAISMGILFTGPMFGGIFSLFTMNSLIMPLFNNNWKLVYFLYSLAPFLAGLIWLFITKNKTVLNKKESTVLNISHSISIFKLIITKKRFINILILGTGGMFLVHSITGWLPKIIHTKGFDLSLSSTLATIPIIVGIVSALTITRFSNNTTRINILAFLFMNAGLSLFFIQSSSLVIIIIGLLFLGLSTGTIIVIILNHMSESKNINYNNIGIAGGIFFSIIQIGGVLGPFFIGLIYDIYNNFNIALSVYSLIMFIMIFPLFIIRNEK
ncbi:MAG: CynX/NimT family MFS transporter [Alphaproteobacteria bacterium]|tara:strand:+ start:8060 stop:9268 length:1209 start_codon:yes stop_codon:yes gene_type:complete